MFTSKQCNIAHVIVAFTFVMDFGELNKASPSGEAPGFGPGIRGFESLPPARNELCLSYGSAVYCVYGYQRIST